MELVRGIPITDFCDQNRLAIRDRIALFVTVCHAVQHAHQKGIIHRDLKPTNVLVTLHDDMPVVKMIDFGIAKAIGQQLTEKTLFTSFAQMIGTPLYISREQAQLTGLDVDHEAAPLQTAMAHDPRIRPHPVPVSPVNVAPTRRAEPARTWTRVMTRDTTTKRNPAPFKRAVDHAGRTRTTLG
jgi:serine/threonine protein kinase